MSCSKTEFCRQFSTWFFLFHFSLSAGSCFYVWNRLREEAKLSFDIWEHGDWAAVKNILDFFDLHTYPLINSQVWKVFNEKCQCKFQEFINAYSRVENKGERHRLIAYHTNFLKARKGNFSGDICILTNIHCYLS